MRPVTFRRQSGVSIMRILGAVCTILIIGGWTMSHANFVLGRSMILAFPVDDTTYRAAWPSITGNVTAKDVTFPEVEGSDLQPFHFDQVRIEVPFFQYFKSGFSRKRGALLNSITEVRIVLTGGRGQYGLPFTSELAAFGAASGAPFEADGCAVDNLWGSDEFSTMGLSAGPTELVVQYQRERSELKLEQSIETPGVGKVSYRGSHEMHDNFSLFSLLDGGSNGIAADEWHLQDYGFNKARNRYCAKKDRITETQFMDRHIAAVKRRLQVFGLAVSADTERAYRDYATKGGSLDIVVRYEPVLRGERLDSDDLGTWVPLMHGELTVNGNRIALGMQSTPVRDLPEFDEGNVESNMLAVLQREQADPLDKPAVTTDVDVASTEQIHADPPGTGATLQVALATDGSVHGVVAAPAAAAPLKSGASGAELALDRMSAAEQALAARAPAIPREAAVPEPVAPRHLANRGGPPVPTSEVMPETRMLYERADQDRLGHLPYEDLAQNIGRTYRVHQRKRPSILVEVTGVEKGIVQVRRRVAGGMASYPLDKASFDYAELLQ